MRKRKFVALAGGVGGAKLVYGFSKILNPECFTTIVNTGDDFCYYGLKVSPDIDSVVYSLAEISDPINGYGRDEDTFNANQVLTELGEPDWFRMGDKDLGLNLMRTALIDSGQPLSLVTKKLCEKLGVKVNAIPMTDDRVQTKVETQDGRTLDFQNYFVKYKYQPAIKRIFYKNIEKAQLCSDAFAAINDAETIVICPSNPWLSIFPILLIPGVKEILLKKQVIAVSPIVGHAAVKGPTAKIFTELGETPNALGIARLYRDLLSTIVIDKQNSNEVTAIEELGIKTVVTDIIMSDNDDKVRLAKEILDFIEKNLT